MKDFAAIDFETANGRRTSVCSVGVVVVRGGEVTDTLYRLIRPRPNFYSRFTTAIHGLSYEGYGPGARFRRRVEADCAPYRGAAARGAQLALRRGCLRAVFELYGMPYPGYRFYCHVPRLAQDVRQQPAQPPQLHTVSAACEFRPCQPPPCPLADAGGVRADRAEKILVPVPETKLPATAGSFFIFLLPGQSPSSAEADFPAVVVRGRTIRCGGCTTCRPVLSGCGR